AALGVRHFAIEGLQLQHLLQSTLKIRVDDCRMDVALPADRFGVAQPLGDRLNRPHEVSLGLMLGTACIDLAQCPCYQDSPGPGAKIFGRKIVSAYPSQVVVHVRASDASALALLLHILKEVLTRQTPASVDDRPMPAGPG